MRCGWAANRRLCGGLIRRELGAPFGGFGVVCLVRFGGVADVVKADDPLQRPTLTIGSAGLGWPINVLHFFDAVIPF